MGVRCFISVNIPEEMKAGIGEMISLIRKTGSDVKCIQPENLHLTLKFLGQTEESLIESIREILCRRMFRYEPFYITIAGTGCFPNEKRPRVLWIGIRGADVLDRIYGDIEEEMASLGYPREERTFSPHLTIGRVKSPRRIFEAVDVLRNYRETDFGSFEVCGITLMKSILKPAGAEYSVLADIPFHRRTDEQR